MDEYLLGMYKAKSLGLIILLLLRINILDEIGFVYVALDHSQLEINYMVDTQG